MPDQFQQNGISMLQDSSAAIGALAPSWWPL
jgi:hypothetical protein